VRRFNALRRALFMLCGGGALALMLAAAPLAAAGGTTYTPETPVVDTISGGPWNTSQGESSASTYPFSDLIPSFVFGGPETTLGGVSEPNVAVYPGAESTKTPPYPSGVVGTPGPLDGYCGAGNNTTEAAGSPVSSQPAGSTLPFAPYYFPDVVRNADGSLTGYFDWRPKDANEAITVARSTDNGMTWTNEGKALEQNPGYCPTADTNDDGEGHPFVTNVNGANTLYTLQRAAGDYEGVGLLVHSIGANSSSDPLANSTTLPAEESSGIDPNTFATAEIPLSTAAKNIPVTTLGSQQGPNTIVAGPYVDYTQNSPTSGSKPTVITCKGTTTSPVDELTECTVPSGTFTVNPKDDLVQVMEQVGTAATVPAGPNTPSGESSKALEKLKFAVNSYGYADATSNSNALAWLMNNNAPNRVYIDGHVVYCNTTNTNPITTNLQFCTSPTGQFTVSANDVITGDPITPPAAQMTTGLVSPDGIVGTVSNTGTQASPEKFNGTTVPSNATIMLYTEKIVNYFVEGELNGSLNSSGTTYTPGTGKEPSFSPPGGSMAYGLNYQPFPGKSEPLPANGTPFTIYTSTTGTSSPIIAITCTNWSTTVPTNAPSGSVDVYNCTGGTAGTKILQTGSTNSKIGEGTGYWIGGPNAAVVPYSVLNKIGEGKDGKTSGPGRLFGNNEDYTVLRAAYTENGVNFTDLGPISGTASETGKESGGYNDISNPNQQESPESSADPTTATTTPTSPTNLTPGSSDEIELRYIGSRGTIITNPDGSLGMFLSGSWPTDGDSDAFNQIFYTSSKDGGQTWSVPKVVLSTEYEFKASREQDEALAKGKDEPLGISAYDSGRAYGPTVVQNPNGTLTMVFSGYRLPKPVTAAGTALGINESAQYTIGAKDPAIYRNILTTHLTSETSPRVNTTTSIGSSDDGTGTVGSPVIYTATVSVNSPDAGTPTGTVSFSDSNGLISGCTGLQLNEGSPDTASCVTTHEHPPGVDEITATYSGDSNYAKSSGTTNETVEEAPAITSAESTTFTEGSGGSFTVTASGYSAPLIEMTAGTLPKGVEFNPLTDVLSGTPTEEGVYHVTFEAANGVGANAVQHFTLTVDAPPVITSAGSTTFTEGTEGSFPVTASGTPAPTITETGKLPKGVTFDEGTDTLSGTPTEEGEFTATFEAANGIGANAVQRFTLTVDAAPVITSLAGATFNEGAEGSFSVTATGTPAPTITEIGTLPHGVKFNEATDTLYGTPTQEGVFKFAFKASNAVGFVTQSFTLTVEAPPAITSADEATFNDHSASSFTVSATGTPAPTIAKWGNLPEGVTFSNGVLSGTPTQTGSFQITLTATNALGSSTQQFTLTVVGLHVTTTSLPDVTLGVPYSDQLEAVGGVAPFKWTKVSGKLPVGLKLSSTGLLSGKVALKKYAPGTSFPFVVKVTDSTKKTHQTVTAPFTVTIE
jgi:hypothetical protein